MPPEPLVGVYLYLGFRWGGYEQRKICIYVQQKLKKKFLSRKDGLLVRSARESIANEVRRDDDENIR